MGSPCLFTQQQALKIGYFYWLRVKNSNLLRTEFSLSNLKEILFCLVVGILHFFGQFRGQRKVLALVKIHQVRNYFPKKSCSTVKLFFFFKHVLYQAVLSKYLKKNRVSPCLFPHKLPRKVDMVLRSQPGQIICAVGTGTRHKMVPIVFEICS